LNPIPPTKLKSINSGGVGGMLNLPQRTGVGQGAKFSVAGKATKAESGRRKTN
jgi:hypothetical protein